MDNDTAEEFKKLESENNRLADEIAEQSKHHLSADEELKKGVLEDLFDSILGNN